MIITSNEVDKIYPALIKAKSEFMPLKKEKINPYFKSKYADLSAIHLSIDNALLSNGLSFAQSVNQKDNGLEIITRIFHSSAQFIDFICGNFPVKDPSPQAVGSTITYGKRYALTAALGISADDDDDGHAASIVITKETEYLPSIREEAEILFEKFKSIGIDKNKIVSFIGADLNKITKDHVYYMNLVGKKIKNKELKIDEAFILTSEYFGTNISQKISIISGKN